MNLLYSASDLMVNTSYFESFGLTALESIASGTPVVGFDSGGTRDIVKNGISGYLGADIQAIVDKILALYKNSKELKSLSASCITYANKKFSPTMVAKKMIKIYGSN
jgi:glycosyltransferase involved in cell wall biosynthesis